MRGVELIRPVRLASVAACLLLAGSAWADDSLGDVLGEFDSLDSYEDVEVGGEQVDPYAWDFGGSVSASAAYNLKDHDSSTGTNYDGLSKARLRLSLNLSKRFNDNWRMLLSGYAWHDLVYDYQDNDYSSDVLDVYETDAQIQDSYVQGQLSERWDVWLGRQVVVWGFADNLRVLDVLNPLDNIEPAIADIEDLRRPVGMLRLNHFRGPWTLSLIAIPEQRFSRNAPIGSDFYPIADANGDALEFREEQPDDFEDINYAASLVGRFTGWDLSLNVARLWNDEPYLDPTAFDITDPANTPDSFNQAAVLRHSRVTFGGFGLQFTRGSWLFKQEAAIVDGLTLTRTEPVTVTVPFPAPVVGDLPIIGGMFPDFTGGAVIPNSLSEHQQTSLLLGAEYYGLASTSIGVEIAARRLHGFDEALAATGYLEERTESSLRVTRDFLREKLRSTFVVIFFDSDLGLGEDGGAIYRLNLDYELAEALELSGGAVVYEGGEQQPYDLWKDNDRLFTEIKWSF